MDNKELREIFHRETGHQWQTPNYVDWLEANLISSNSVLSAVLPIVKGHWEDRDNDGYDDTWVDDEA